MADNPVAGCVETMKHRFTDFKKSYFVEARRHKMISQGFWTT
jgi:hypothetical protein